MNIKFEAIGLSFTAEGDMEVVDEYFDFKSLKVDGSDAMFLTQSSTIMDLIDQPAYKAALAKQLEEKAEAAISRYEHNWAA